MKHTELKSRNEEIAQMYSLEGKERLTLQQIGDKYGMTRERVRQIAQSYGKHRPMETSPVLEKICAHCKVVFRTKLEGQSFCNRACFVAARIYTPKEREQAMLRRKEKSRAYHVDYYQKNKNGKIKEYQQKNKERINAYMRGYYQKKRDKLKSSTPQPTRTEVITTPPAQEREIKEGHCHRCESVLKTGEVRICGWCLGKANKINP